MSVGPIRHPARDRDAFDARHGAWLGRVPGGPLYCLPEPAIARLAQPHLGRTALLDEAAARAERDLLGLCLRHCAVGYAGPRPISYPYLTPPLPPPGPDLLAVMGWTAARGMAAAVGAATAGRASARLKGYAGWLSTEPAFLEAAAALARRWEDLPESARPDLPLQRATPALAPSGIDPGPPATDPVGAFAADFAAFCDRWGLTGMATWDLPTPQGPLLPALLPAGSPALPDRGVHLFLPVHYPLMGDDELLADILRQQRAEADRLGLDASVAGLPHHIAYAQILDVVHLERTIAGRYAADRRPRGFVGSLIEAIAEAMGQSVDHVRRLRKAISACRRGRRAAVDRLRPRRGR